MISGFVDGIKSKISAVTDAVSNVTSAVKGFLGFSSPAKKGEGRHIVNWGANMIDGFLDGVRSQERNAQLAMNNIVGAMQPSSMETIDINGSIARSNAQIGSRISHEITNDGGGRMEQLLSQIANNGQVIVLDSGELVGATYPQYDRVGGSQTQLTERWGR